MDLARPCDTRRGSHFRSLNNVITMYSLIRQVLTKIGKEYHRVETVSALTMLTSFLSFEFVFVARLIQEIFGFTHDLGRDLQKKDQDIVDAIELVDDTNITCRVGGRILHRTVVF